MGFQQPIDVRDFGAIGDGILITTSSEINDVYINYILELDMNI